MIPEVRSVVTVVTPNVVIPATFRFLEISTSVVAIETGVGAEISTDPVDALTLTLVPAEITVTTPTARVDPSPMRL